jgi:arylsulfatase A-like enzyme
MGQKNVLILHTDQQRYDSLGCSGNAYARTPNTDQLAAEGTRFTRHISANSVCMPSRASLMTGLYPPGHGVWTNGVALNRQEYAHITPPGPNWRINLALQPSTLADVFGKAGYDTVSYGKLHLTPNLAPPEYGYHETWSLWEDGTLDDWHGPYYGFRYVDMTTGHGEHPCTSGHYGRWLQSNHPKLFEQVVENQKHKSLPVPALGDLYASPLPVELHHSAWLADRFCQYLESRRPDQPFFAFVGFPDPHHPFTPCTDSVELFQDAEVKEPSDPNGEALVDSPVRDRFGTDIAHLSIDERRTIVRYTCAMVYQIDQAVGRIVEALKAKGLWEETIIVFTSDHGDFLGDHGRLRKNTVGSDALLHLPFVLRAPGAGLPDRVDTPMSNVDVMPTLTTLTGVEAPEWQHGRDMTSAIETEAEHYAFAFCASGDRAHLNYTVYDADYRLTYYPRWDYTELYDHRTDPGECTNLAARETTQTARLMDVLKTQLVETYNPIVGRVCLW